MNWTPEQYEAFKQKQIAKRLEAEEWKKTAKKLLSASKRGRPPVVKEPKADCGVLAKSQIRKQNPEYKIQAAFVREMAVRYPGVMVFSDCAAHIKKTMFQQKRANALSTPGEKWPDVFVAQPSGEYAGLWLEFKAETPYKKDNVTLLANPHIEAQRETMGRLSERGYQCYFVWDVSQAMSIVNNYLNL